MRELQTTRISVAQLLQESIGATRDYHIVTPVAHLAPELAQTEPISGHAHLLQTGNSLLLQADFSGQIITQCSRCLADVALPVSPHIEEEFQPTVDIIRGTYIKVEEEDAALLIDEQHILDLGEVLRQALLLELPLQPLCRPDCAGLCPICGQDLNEGPCDCTTNDIDPRWEQLSVLLDSAAE